MPVTTVIDIEFFPFRQKKLQVEERIIVPLGNRIIWRLLPIKRRDWLPFPPFEVKLYFENLSPFAWKEEKTFVQGARRLNLPVRIASARADTEGEYKYGIEIQGQGSSEFRYDEDPYLIIRRF